MNVCTYMKVFMSNIKEYDDKQRSDFVELAEQIGIGRAIRELGYPSYPTAQAWCRARGVTPNKDSAYAQVKEWHTLYQVEDILIVIDEGISAAQELITRVDTPDDLKKIAEAVQKLGNTRLLLEGKSTSITEKRDTTPEDTEFAKALRELEGTSFTPGEIKADDLM